MRWQAVVVLLMTVCLPLAASGVNLLGKAQGCILSGSSFAAEQKSWKLETVHYFDRLADGKKHTCWKAFDSKAPHYIKARWRTPVKFNQIEWQGRNFEKLALKEEKLRLQEEKLLKAKQKLEKQKLKTTLTKKENKI